MSNKELANLIRRTGTEEFCDTVENIAQTAETWREKARRLRLDWMSANQGQTEIAAAALETCADEIDGLLRGGL